MSCEIHGRTNNVVCPACDAELVEDYQRPAITFLNGTGDITITWDEQNKDKIIELIRRKMEEGYTFFTTHQTRILKVTKRVAITEKNINKIETLIISDEDFEKLVADMDDGDIATSVRKGHAHLSRREKSSNKLDAVKRLTSPEEVLDKQTLAVRPVAGG